MTGYIIKICKIGSTIAKLNAMHYDDVKNPNLMNYQIYELQCQIEELECNNTPSNVVKDLLEKTESPLTENIRMAIIPDVLKLFDTKYDEMGTLLSI